MNDATPPAPLNGWTAETVFEQFAAGALDEAVALSLLSRMADQGDPSNGSIKNGSQSNGEYTWSFAHGNSFLADHRVGGRDVVVMALYLTLAAEWFRRKSMAGDFAFAIEDLEVVRMVEAARGETVEVCVSPSTSGDGVQWQTRNAAGGDWTQSARARIVKASQRPPGRNVSLLSQRVESALSGEILYDPLRGKPGFQLGALFQNVRSLRVANGEVLAEVRSKLNIDSEARSWLLDPTLVYGCHFSALYLHPLTRRSIYLPVSARSLVVFGPLRELCFSLARVVHADEDAVVHDIEILDRQGAVSVRIEGLRSVNTRVPFITDKAAPAGPGFAPVKSNGQTSKNGSLNYGHPKINDSDLAAAIEDYIIAKLQTHLPSGAHLDTFRTAHFMEMGLGSTELIGMTREVEGEIGIELYPTLFFEYQNLRELSAYFATEHRESFERFLNQPGKLPCANGEVVSESPPEKPRFEASPYAAPSNRVPALAPPRRVREEDIAIIGMAGRFAQSPNLVKFWDNLVAGKHLVGELPKKRLEWDSLGADAQDIYCQWGSFLEDVDRFDALFFKISPIEAEMMDPQLRLLLEVLYETSEDAAYASRLRGSRTGLFVGACSQDYYQNLLVRSALGRGAKPAATLSNLPFVLANRPSFIFDLQGPSFAVDTACSSSLVALHLACQSLRNGESDMAFAAGVNLILNPYYHAGLCSMGALTRTGACHTFDKKADGYVRGEGVAAVLLKPLSAAIQDHDNIHAVIKATHLNHGGHSNSFTAPRPELQARLLAETWKMAEIDPETIGYLDAHGTGTQLGDPIEVQAIHRAFRQFTQKKGFCALGSVKAHIGHTEAAAGLAGVLKTVLCLKNRLVPRMPLFADLNPYIDLEDSPLSIRRENVEWPENAGAPRRGCVSSFGIGGANAHVVLEAFDPVPPALSNEARLPAKTYVFPFSAQSKEQLESLLRRVVEWLASDRQTNPAEIAYTLQMGRESFAWRAAFLAESNAQLRDFIEGFLAGKPLSEELFFQGRAGFSESSGQSFSRHNADMSDAEQSSATLASNWVKGQKLDWANCWKEARMRPVSLPTYPFATTRYWYPLDDPQAALQKRAADHAPPPKVDSGSETSALLLFSPQWQPQEAPPSAPSSQLKELAGATVLLFGAEKIARDFDATFAPGCGPNLVRITTGNDFRIIDSGRIEWRIEEPDDHKRLAAHLDAQRVAEPLWVFYDASELGRADFSQPAESSVATARFTSALFAFGKFLARVAAKTPVRCAYYFASSGEPSPLHAFAAGFLKSLCHESPRLSVRWIGVPEERLARNSPNLAAVLMGEWSASQSQTLEVNYIGGRRHIKSLQEISLPDAVPLRRGGAYLITGGLGGIGRVAAAWLCQNFDANIVLIGRSDIQSNTFLDEAKQKGWKITYLRADISNLDEVRAAFESIRIRFGELHGIIHAAGVLRDALLIGKSADDFQAVLAPKIQGLINLDAACAPGPSDFFIFCSSLSALAGNPGQSDYAGANAFMDAFAELRNSWLKQSVRQGRALSVNWPLWDGAGMAMPPHRLALLEQSGLKAMPADRGMETLMRLLGFPKSQVGVFFGDPLRIREICSNGQESRQEPVKLRTPLKPQMDAPNNGGILPASAAVEETLALDYLKNLLAREFKIPLDKIDRDEPFESFGLDSLLITRFNAALEADLGPISKTLFFEHRTPGSLAQYFAANKGSQISLLLKNRPPALPETASVTNSTKAPVPRVPRKIEKTGQIAIIGVAGRYPEAKDLDEYWKNLRNGRDCIREIPPERWDYRPFYNSQPGVPGKMYCKWGGFLNDACKFDASFFNLTPREAAYMDPQERLFLETTWAALEDAGYTRKSLAACCATAGKGLDVGVFVGVTWNSYQLLAADRWAAHQGDAVTASTWSIANRVSFFFDFAGPSISIDTACSSSLVAIDHACESIRRGDCRIAIAGGVNLYLHPLQYISLCRARFLSTDGKCRSFGAGGDGFIPGEGVGALLLKPLDLALKDQDNIWGVIKGSAVNHGGRTHGYTVPNPNAQASLIREALTRAGVSPQSLNYIEAHGTGTALGDPVEVSGLVKAFDGAAPHSCALGSVKSNIGHLESAAGIAGLTKVLLQMRHRFVAPTLHAETPNPNITFDTTPFYLNQSAVPWRSVENPESGKPNPLRAGISSFGAGGVNAHIVVESAPDTTDQPIPPSDGPQLIVLSARNNQSLGAYHERLCESLEKDSPNLRLCDIAYTLQTGREPMESRMALVVESIPELVRALANPAFKSTDASRKRPRIAFLFTDSPIPNLNPNPNRHAPSPRNSKPLAASHPTFRETLERLTKLAKMAQTTSAHGIPHGSDARQIHPAKKIGETAALFAWQRALTELWKSLGIIPDVVIGHGAGEFAAGCAAGIFSDEEGTRLVADPARLTDFHKVAREIKWQTPSLQFLSTRPSPLDEAAPERHWESAVRRPSAENSDPNVFPQFTADIVIEIGASSALPASVEHANNRRAWLPGFGPGQNELHSLLCALGQLFVWGVQPIWEPLNETGSARRISLPTYQFQGSIFSQFIAANASAPQLESPLSARENSLNPKPSAMVDAASKTSSPLIQFRALNDAQRESWMTNFLREQIAAVTQGNLDAITPASRWQDLAMDSIMVMELVSKLQKSFDLMLYPREVYETPDVAALSQYLTNELLSASVTTTHANASTERPSEAKADRPLTSKSLGIEKPASKAKKLPGIIFVLSSPRSGSTLLRVMLAGHPGLFSPPELHLLAYFSMGERRKALAGSHLDEGLQRAFMDAKGINAQQAKELIDELCANDAPIADVYALLQKAAEGRLLIDKSPTYGLEIEILRRAETLFDRPRYIHLVRHPAAVIESSVRMRMQRLAGKSGTDPYSDAEELWRSANQNIFDFGQSIEPERYVRTRYEDLVAQPEPQMRALCEHLNIPFNDALLHPYDGKRMTDGVHARSMPIGDPNFSKHSEIAAELGESWKNARLPSPLQPSTLKLSRQFGYEVSTPSIITNRPECQMIERWVTVRGVRLCVCAWGEGPGPAVWLLHGLLEQAAAWGAVASALAARGYRVFAPDLRGHGLSDHATAGCGYHLADFLADMEGLPRVLTPGNFILAGHSFGSIIATLLSGARAALIDRLILIEPILPPKQQPVPLREQLTSYLDRSTNVSSHSIFSDLSAATARLRQGIPSLSDALAARLALRLTEPCEGGVKWRWDPRLQSRTSVEIAGTWLSRADYLSLLEPQADKLTLIYGDRGLNRDDDKMDARPNFIPSARSVSLSGGHHLHVDVPEELAESIHTAVSRVASGGASSQSKGC